ncbi:beta-glucosidase 13-like [Vicia villosa]|uniref:beta-glucosidase 13-like n=1 Tax=Vicia villosa TaxID=3911 RepID=UPI00273AF917|nr:beta-glucosidase 13-like [Vicia villosa]
MQQMETLSSLRNFETILSIIFFVLLSNVPDPAQGYLLSKKNPNLHHLSASKIVEATTTNPYDSILEFLNSSSFPNRASFPQGFLFGSGSSALQIEGGCDEGGRGLGIWDDIVIQNKDIYLDVDKFPLKIDHYKRYKEDVQHLKKLGINSYRMSISWSRIMPDGTLKGGINQEGVNFYNNLINELLENGIEPFVGIMHFDYPLALKQKFGGFLNRSIVKYYKDYSELLFKTYGDRVKHWTTINEAEVTAMFHFMFNLDKVSTDQTCKNTKICTQAYTLLHNFLIAHATASKLYTTKFQEIQRGEIGLALSSGRYVPYSSKLEDVVAAQRLMDFYWGWILDPVFHGDYPQIMKKLVGNRLPKFTKKEKHMLKGSANFIGVNYYTSHFARHESNRTKIMYDNFDALAVSEDFNAEGKTLGYKDQYSGSNVYPEGLYNMLVYIKKKYKNPKIYITENGISSTKIPNPLKDEHRIAYIAAHINATKAAIDDGVNVQGYFLWAAFDTYEFQAGYSGNWGLYHIDFNNNLNRLPTDTAIWYKKYLTNDIRN